ncbi:heat shock 70 kDa protein 12A-like [Periophthalmus magnuspinnatus]|uniref:heat shock 70 kDa protein 12A-like n=1 Tax=Periophthalmus magnuspinnatus TaxID=409849 RepID=UPI00145A76B6|nr:heat shock 70 kDa protein 12A-like [Periophthalmus magnuspinnatus]
MSRSCIIAIDFGTAYSGYAYSLTLNNQQLERVKRWERKSGADTSKTPTCILFDENKEFVDFGYRARDKYNEMCRKTANYYYFKDFKMELYKQKITKNMEIRDVNKRQMEALKVFSAALRFLKDDALEALDKETQNMAKGLLNFTWVLTVPAIWDNPARQVMREAAVQAGLVTAATEDKLVIALEPEAASIQCKQLCSEDFMMAEAPVEINLSPGTQYIVVDCGGGTIDITVHEVLEGGRLKELHKASGNDKGGRRVDRKFVQCMREFFCDGLWEEYETDFPSEAQAFMEDFICFRQADHAKVRQLDFYEKFKYLFEKKKTRNEVLFEPMDGMTFHWVKQPNAESYSAKLEISEKKMESFFRETLVHVTDSLSEILNKHSDIKYIMLVGGLSSSHILRRHVYREFSDQAKVLCPKNPQEAILKGAVMFGRDQSVIQTRKSAFTYGLGVNELFDPSLHKPGKKYTTKEGVIWCGDIFSKLVGINEDVEWNSTREYKCFPIESDQKKMELPFYRTERETVMYVDDWGVEGPVAECVVDMPDTAKGTNREVKLEVFFGSTEIKAKATDLESKSTVSVIVDFIAS